jgi:hypothetical protein
MRSTPYSISFLPAFIAFDWFGELGSVREDHGSSTGTSFPSINSPGERLVASAMRQLSQFYLAMTAPRNESRAQALAYSAGTFPAPPKKQTQGRS